MLNRLYLTSLAAAVVLGTPVERRDDTQPVGTNPITNFNTQFLGEQKSSNSCAGRDLGFTGELGGKWYGVYGDTNWCAGGVSDPDQNPPGFHGIVRDTIALMGGNPLIIQDYHLNGDTPVPHPLQFVPYNEAWGETNMTISYLRLESEIIRNYNGKRQKTYNTEDSLVVTDPTTNSALTGLSMGERTGSRVFQWLWSASATRGGGGTRPRRRGTATWRRSGTPSRTTSIAWGGAPTSITDFTGSQYVYMTRVNAADAFDLSKYEYWWGRGQGWKSDVLNTFTADTAVFWGTGWAGANVVLRTATALEGPWTPDVAVFTATPVANNGFVYAGVAHPYLDTSGRTLTISYSNGGAVIQVIKVTFSK
ncbi:hypothetical protein CIB48_g9304 [Xylaria polymorpha]|nr:hypothetical protein CIB48_g9304 [Xylaria polymorpha]